MGLKPYSVSFSLLKLLARNLFQGWILGYKYENLLDVRVQGVDLGLERELHILGCL